jgi:hypothetical protein
VEFKRQAVDGMKRCENNHELARDLKVQHKLLRAPRHANLGTNRRRGQEKWLPVAKLKRALGSEFFESALPGKRDELVSRHVRTTYL